MNAIILTLLTVLGLSSISLANASENKFICSAYYIYKYETRVRTLKNDKQMHCSMSCLLARKCGALESGAVGYIKEIVDAFTSGTPDRNDIKANKKGIKFAKKARSEAACINYCKKIFPEK